MSDPRSVRVFVNAKALEMPSGSTAIDAVRAFDGGLVPSVMAGSRFITDSRGLRTSPDAPVHAGSIFRVVANRTRSVNGPVDG